MAQSPTSPKAAKIKPEYNWEAVHADLENAKYVGRYGADNAYVDREHHSS